MAGKEAQAAAHERIATKEHLDARERCVPSIVPLPGSDIVVKLDDARCQDVDKVLDNGKARIPAHRGNIEVDLRKGGKNQSRKML